MTTPPITPGEPPRPARKFVFSIFPEDADALALLSKLRTAFPELAWQGGERPYGGIHLAGESREEPSKVGVHLLCEHPPGPFTLTIRLESTEAGTAEADALKARVISALVAAIAPWSASPFPPPPPLDPSLIPRPPQLISPQPMPLQTLIHPTKLEGKEIQLYGVAKNPVHGVQETAEPGMSKDFRFESVMAVPEAMEPAVEPRLRKAFPELEWEDHAENWGKVRIEGTSRETPGRVVVSIVRNESPGTFKLGTTISARDQSEAVKSLSDMIERIKSALLGWSIFHLPAFKTRPPSGTNINQEEVVDLVFPLEYPRVRLFQAGTDILISRILLEALSVKGEILDSRAKEPEKYPGSNDLEGRATSMRGAAARLILRQAVPAGPGKDLEIELTLVRAAHSLLGELLELGWAQVVQYGPGGRGPGAPSTSPRRIKVHYFGSRMAPKSGFGYISYYALGGEAPHIGEFLRLDWWVS